MRILPLSDKPKIETWFPKPIYIRNNFGSKYHYSLHQWLLEFFAINGEFKRTKELNVNTTHEVYDLVNEPIFADFIQDLTKEVKSFATDIGYGNFSERIRLQNMWSNISRTGDYLFPHNHPSSLISGAYYIESTSSKDVIKFYNDIESMLPPALDKSGLSFEDVSYECVPQRLLLFKSDFMHGCPALIGERKIVVSFNYGLS